MDSQPKAYCSTAFIVLVKRDNKNDTPQYKSGFKDGKTG